MVVRFHVDRLKVPSKLQGFVVIEQFPVKKNTHHSILATADG